MKKYPTPHINASPEDFAKTVLMPGDPLRAKFIAENYLEDPVLINSVRGMLGYTGRYKGKKITVMASGMGLNAFFVYTVCLGFGLSYSNALVLILAEGLIFILLTVTGLRKKIFESLPDAVRVAIPGGIGLFIALLGLQNAGLVVPNSST